MRSASSRRAGRTDYGIARSLDPEAQRERHRHGGARSCNESGTEGRAHTGTSVPEMRLVSAQTELFSRQVGRHGKARPCFPSQVSWVRVPSSASRNALLVGPDIASYLRIEERELEAGGLN